MANIDRYLSNIKSALFGKEVRDSMIMSDSRMKKSAQNKRFDYVES